MLKTVLSEMERLKLRNIILYNSGGLSIIADYFLLSTADSLIQMEGIRNRLIELMDEYGVNLKNPLEEWHDGWCLLDFGNLIIHIFLEEIRSFYNLEGIFSGAGFKTQKISK
ncbi:MAG: ribosome silencing factor [Brevinematia bacterium]